MCCAFRTHARGPETSSRCAGTRYTDGITSLGPSNDAENKSCVQRPRHEDRPPPCLARAYARRTERTRVAGRVARVRTRSSNRVESARASETEKDAEKDVSFVRERKKERAIQCALRRARVTK